MGLLDKAERKYGRYGIPNLIIIIIAGNALVWLMGFVFEGNPFVDWLILTPSDVFGGQVWRVLSFVFCTSYGETGNIFFMAIGLYFLYMIGTSLEYHWGSFRLSVYYAGAVLLTVLVSLLTGSVVTNANNIHISLFFAFATIAPETRFMIFFIIPVKAKWMAWLSAGLMALDFVMKAAAGDWRACLLVLASVATYFLFFGSDIYHMLRSRGGIYTRRQSFERKKRGGGAIVYHAAFHKCEVCGITERDAPDMEFRYCSKCAGNHEYCMNHLNNHIHFSE